MKISMEEKRDIFQAAALIWNTQLSQGCAVGDDSRGGCGESTGGFLWVVGKDPNLFDLFDYQHSLY